MGVELRRRRRKGMLGRRYSGKEAGGMGFEKGIFARSYACIWRGLRGRIGGVCRVS